MSSGISTDTASFQPWQFFVIATMLAATVAVLVARETTLANLILISLTVMSGGLVGLAVFRTLSPLADARSDDRHDVAGGRARHALEREKALVLRSIKELEFDRAMGKIAEPDFQEMVLRLRTRAIGLMKQLDEQPQEWRQQIERDLQRRLSAAGLEPAPAPAAASRADAGTACAVCETMNDHDARFCKSCGARLSAAH